MEMWSPYASNFNNPIRYKDFLGDEPDDGLWGRLQQAVINVKDQIISAALGAGNAYVTNQFTAGIGRKYFSETGLTGNNAIAYQIGQKGADAYSTIQGAIEVLGSGVDEVLTVGVATPIAVPALIHGTVATVVSVKNLATPIKFSEGGTTKSGGKYTEPTLPSKTVADNGKVKAEHYTRSGDHGPPHVHVKGGGPETKVGQNGKPTDGSPELTPTQQKFVNEFKSDIRSALKKIGRWYNYNRQ
ncbi:DUF4160 domain-containing protein [Chitinophaga sp. Cy-1792]|uniref:DUF4160 domain-containing protein n=1 Tax=Chitinophaga sp. Cy-1792 TaxID=2608339 RepID=UPI0014230FE6|nr:DUF4160 domain-containing protein [Chitinophaga sp. Cy-1792]NIG53533.1 DUF4160 domain-containing protein [Chitinophaga sp. Cy-1792]